MKIILPGPLTKDKKPTACNANLNGDQIECCLVFDFVLTKEEARQITQAAENEIIQEQAVDSERIAEKQMLIDGLNPLITP